MANGNMGELWFNLGVKDSTSKTFNQILKLVNETDGSVSALRKKIEGILLASPKADELSKEFRVAMQNAYDYFGMLQKIETERGKIAGLKILNKDASNLSDLDRADGLLKKIKTDLTELQLKKFGGVDKADLMPYQKALTNTLRDVKELSSAFQKDNSLSAAASNAARLKIELEKLSNKLSEVYAKQSEGMRKGYDTRSLLSAGNTLRGVKTRTENMLGDDKMLSNEAKFKSLLSDIAYASEKAKGKISEYEREKSKTIEANREAAAQQKKNNEALQESARRQKELADNTRRLKDLYSKLNHEIAMAEGYSKKGASLGVDTKQLDKALADMRDYANMVNSVSPGLMGKGGRPVLDDYKQMAGDLKRALDEAVQSQKKLNGEKEKSNRKDEAEKVRQEAAELRKAAAIEKQRQNEIKQSQLRYERLSDVLTKLRSVYDKGVSLNVDTRRTEAKIREIESQMTILAGLKQRLEQGDLTAVGQLGRTGDSRQVQLGNRAAAEQQKANTEKQKAIELERKHQQEVAATASRIRSDLVSALDQAKKSAGGINSTMQELKSLFLQGGIVYGAKQFFDAVVQTGGEIEKQHIALQSILGDRAKADELFQQTQQLALQSPFKFGELNKDVKQLAAFGVEADDLYDTTKRLADIASGLGVDFSRLGLAYGQVKARSWLDGKELRQFAYAGLPLLKSITELYNQTGKNGRTDYTEGDVKKMISNREVSFEDVQKVLWNMTDEGGQFYNMQFVLSETLLGKYNKLIDAWEIMLSKFADGKSIIGGVFKTAITGATDLVLAMDKLSPALIAFGAMFAMKKGWGALTAKTGLGAISTQMKAAQVTALRTYAIEQQQAVIEGKISQEKMRQNIADRQGLINRQINKRNTIESLALQGKLSALQMQRAFREKLISPELVKQLQTMGLISAKQSELIMKSGKWARVSLAARQAWAGISGLFSIGNIAMIGLTAAFAIWQKIDADQEKVKQRTKDISESARNHAQAMADALKQSGNVDTSDPQKLQQTNDALKDVLEQSGYYTDTIREQVEEAQTLTEQYKILKKAVEDAKNGAETEDKLSGVISGAIASSGNWANDDITENAAQAEDYYNKLSVILDGFDAKTRAKMESVANSMLKPEDASMSLEEKILKLYESGEGNYRKFVGSVSEGSCDVANSMNNVSEYVQKTEEELDEIAHDDIPKIIKYISKSLGMNEKDFIKWASKNVTTFDTMFTKILNLCNLKVPEIVKKIREILYESLKLQDPQKPKGNGNNKPKVWKNPLKTGGVGRKAFDKLLNAGKLNGGKNGFWQKEMAEMIKTIGGSDGNSWHDFGESLQKAYKDVRNENNSAKKAGEKQPYYRKQKMLEALAGQVGVSLDVGKDRVTGDFGKDKDREKKEDKVLDALKERISLYKTYYSELQKLKKTYGQGAEERLQENDDFKPIKGYGLSNSSDYRKSITELTDKVKKSTPDRRAYIDKAIADISSKDRELEEKSVADINNELREKLNLLSEEYTTYKKLYDLTGDQRGSMQLAFGEQVESPTIKEALRNKMQEVLPEANQRSGLSHTADDVLGMSEADFKEAYGENSKEISEVYKQWRTETKKLKQETISLMQEIIEKSRTTQQQIDDRKRKHEQDVQRIEESDTSPEMKKRAKEGELKAYGDDMSKLQLQQFKEEKDWVVIFDDLNNVGSRTISNLITDIDNFSRSTTLSVTEVKELRGAIQKLRDEQVDRNPFAGMFGDAKAAHIGSYMRKNKPGADGKYDVGESDAKKMGISAGKYTKAELESQKGVKSNGLQKSLSSLQKKFQALSDVLSPVVSLMDALGSEDTTLSQILQGGSDAFGAATGTAGGINTLKDTLGDGALKDAIGSAGPYGAAASAAISIIGSFAAAHDAALEKEIEASKQRQKEMENLTKNVQTVVENELGGVYTYMMDAKTRKKLQDVTEIYDKEITKLHYGKNGYYLAKDGKSRYSSGTNKAVQQSLSDPSSAFAAQYASLRVQRDELQKQRDSENKKKKKDKSAISDYDQQITEMEQEIQNFTNEWMKSIYDIDLKDWASQLTEAIVDAWSKGEDAVDAYKDKVQEMMNSLTKNILSQSIMEILLKPTLEKISKKLQDSGGKLKADDVIDITDSLIDAEGSAIESITQILEELKKKGVDLSENGSLSTSNSIKSITEETADLLASYINAIRLDVSVNRENVRLIAQSVRCLPNINVVAESQLASLNTLVSLAEQRNGKLDMMYDWMRGTTNGTKKISIA